jgi:Putative transmembrane protein (PGPGW)
MKQFKRIAIAVAGGTVVAIGIAMIVLPGPAIIVIPAGLAILAIEFAWARRWMRLARAALPRRSSNGFTSGKLSVSSVRRRVEFLFRQIRRTLSPKAKAF